ncbi:hypothetical protein TEA_008804 [Camellia sinensis var. sinensis]|uniref:Uncharacterized protein n=1 Tax=Camellia sinensis var. sinensis TaxID=542762 RepID=A0A4S4DLX7_CAMSN|nr:hypothetical protein TEA_008804 [Camellia sinensis var. sinensis]
MADRLVGGEIEGVLGVVLLGMGIVEEYPENYRQFTQMCVNRFLTWQIRLWQESRRSAPTKFVLVYEEQRANISKLRGLLKFTTDRGRIYLSTSGSNFRGIDMLNNDHMMIMFFAVTSTFAMAMVPFARTATTVTMMYPTMTVMSSTVTTTGATMSVITMTMLMNMMSPAMTVVLVNKMSPAVTVMPSDMTSCTSVMSAGAVVS